MDRTPEFVDALKSSQHLLLTEDVRIKDGKYSLLLSKKSGKVRGDWSVFTEGLKKLVKNITRMKNLLLENRKDYVNLYSHLISEASSMTDKERDQIDYDVHVFMKNCNDLLRNYRNELNLKTSAKGSSTQAKDHFNLVLSLIEAYLKYVCDIYTEQKAIRVRRACERQRLSRLAATFSSGNFASNFMRDSPSLLSSSTSASTQDNDLRNTRDTGTSTRGIREEDSRSQTSRDSDHSSRTHVFEENGPHLTPQEVQLFDQENHQLYDELTSLTDEVKVIGGKVMEIARLQEIFTEKVLQQENELDRLSSTVVASTESIRDGNDQLREAIRKGAGFRVWVLLFIMTLALTILFLDWYNP